MYGAGEYCPGDGRDCMPLNELEAVMMTSRDYDENLEAWTGWRTVSPCSAGSMSKRPAPP